MSLRRSRNAPTMYSKEWVHMEAKRTREWGVGWKRVVVVEEYTRFNEEIEHHAARHFGRAVIKCLDISFLFAYPVGVGCHRILW